MAENCKEPLSLLAKEDLRRWRDVPRNDASPFVHRFQTARGKYVYDVNTRRIIRVERIIWDVLEDYGNLDEDRIRQKHSSSYTRDEITAALGQIARTIKERGLFLPSRPEKVRSPGEDYVRARLEDRREQLILNVTEDCNFRCSYCVFGGAYSHYPARSSRMMAWEVARPAIDEFLAHSGRSQSRVISFYGGEPLLNLPLIRQCVAYVRDNPQHQDVQFAATTNGSLLEGEAAEFLARERFMLVVSLDGPAEIHDSHRRMAGGDPSWEIVMRNVRGFLDAHPEYRTNGAIRFNAVATRTTDLRQAQEFWTACDAFTESMGLEISEQKDVGKANALAADDPLVASAVELQKEFVQAVRSGNLGKEYKQRGRWVQTALFQKPFILFHKRKYLSPRLPKAMTFMTGCIPGVRRAFVGTDGDYYACERVVPCPKQAIGNVRGGVRLASVMAIMKEWAVASGDQCRYCWCLSHCMMGCLATVEANGGITAEDKNRRCAIYRREMHRLLQEYTGILETNPKAFDYMAGFEIM